MTTERINDILTTVYQRVQTLIPVERFYAIIYDVPKNMLNFPLVRQENNSTIGDQHPWVARACTSSGQLPDDVILQGKPVLYSENFVKELAERQTGYWPDEEPPYSWLATPLSIGGQTIGALVLENWSKSRPFKENDLQVLTTIARQTATAIENVRLYQKLERKIENLRILNQIGQQLTRGQVKQEKEILDWVYNSATKLQLDTSSMYIAFYDHHPERLDTEDDVHGTLRFVLSFVEGVAQPPSSRLARDGLSGYVIRSKQSYKPLDVTKAYKDLLPSRNDRIRTSWLGVPMLSEGQVFGVIVLRSNQTQQAYTQDDQEILEILAGQAAVALQNLQLEGARERAREQQAAAENMATMNMVAAEFAHKMNNLGGTIPPRIATARNLANINNPNEAKIIDQLMIIEEDVMNIIQAAKEIRESSNHPANSPTPEEKIDVNQLIKTASARAQNNRVNPTSQVDVVLNLSENLPLILAGRTALLDIFTSIIKNGCEAISNTGTVTITTQRAKFRERNVIEVKVTDNGKGIPIPSLPRIFDLFYSTKGEQGLGFGLWRDRIELKRLGGDIDVYSEETKGSTFTIRIPIA